MKPLYTFNFLRAIILPLFARINLGDITIRHHYTGQPFRLHSFKHKGYWYHGTNREREVMSFFGRMIRPGDTVVEIGGHIGYITLYFAQLVGESGKVISFEPGPNNLPYLHQNTAEQKNITIIEKAVSDKEGSLPFYIENLTGQNNTLLKDFETFSENSALAHVKSKYAPIMVNVVSIDHFYPGISNRIDFLKIDIEGAEVLAIQGGYETLQTCKPIVMVECNSTSKDLFSILHKLGYQVFTPDMKIVTDYTQIDYSNLFCLHPERHRNQIAEMLS